MSTTYNAFENAFKATKLFREYIVYDVEVIEFCKANNFSDLSTFYDDLLTRSYPEEVLRWAKDSIYYMYECNMPVVNASIKYTPDFLLKNK